MSSLLDFLTPEQKQQLVAEMMAASAPAAVSSVVPSAAITQATATAVTQSTATAVLTPPAPRRSTKSPKLDLSDAIDTKFRVSLSANERCRDHNWAATYDTVTVRGHYQVKGPKGGMYCLGQAVLSSREGDIYSCTLKISNKSFLDLKSGGAIDGWCIDADTGESLFIGTLSGFQPVK